MYVNSLQYLIFNVLNTFVRVLLSFILYTKLLKISMNKKKQDLPSMKIPWKSYEVHVQTGYYFIDCKQFTNCN